MSLVLPSASVTVQNGGLGVIQSSPTNVHVVIGPSSKGPFNTPLQFNRFSDAVSTFGCGLMPKAAAYCTRGVRARYICIRVPSVDETPYVSSVTKPAGKTVSLSGSPSWGYDVVIHFVAGGTIGVAGITYKVSLNGGTTFGSTTPLGTATSIDVDGVSVTLTSGESWSAGQEISYQTRPGSQAIGNEKITRAGSSTASIAFSGSPEDEYEIVFSIVKGGTVGTAGITYRYSLDGGYTFTTETALNDAITVALKDGDEESGVTVSLGIGTLDAGDKATASTTGRAIQTSDVQTAIDALRASTYTYRFVHVVGDSTVAKAQNVAGIFDTLAGQGIFTYGMMSARDRTDGEIDAFGKPGVLYHSRLVSEFSTLATDRLAVSAGRARVLCPVTGRQNRRPASWPTVARLIEKGPQVDPGRVREGALTSDVNLYNTNGSLVEVDSRINETLHDARFVTLRTYDRRQGVYITRGSLQSGSMSDFSRIALRAVMDIASEVFLAVGEDQLENHLVVNPANGVQPGDGDVPGQSATPGALSEADCRALDQEFQTALETAVLAPGYVTAISCRTNRENNFLSTGELEAEVEITPLGYVDQFKGKISFVSKKNA